MKEHNSMEKFFSSVEEVIVDENFQAWYFKSSYEAVESWEKFMASRPELDGIVNQAIDFMSRIHIREKQIPKEQSEKALERLRSAMETETQAPVVPMRSSNKRWWMVAAAAILIIGFSIFRFYSQDRKTLATQYGQLSQHILPDGSEVM